MIPKNQESEQVFGFFKVITTYTFIYISYFRVLYIYTKWSNLKEHYRRLQWWLLLQIRNNTLVLCRARKHTIAEITFAHTHYVHMHIYAHKLELQQMYLFLISNTRFSFNPTWFACWISAYLSLSLCAQTHHSICLFNTFEIMNLCGICCVHQCDNALLLDYNWQSMRTISMNERKSQRTRKRLYVQMYIQSCHNNE